MKMTKEQLAVLADDIASMSQEFIDSRDAVSLRNMAANLANMIRIHVGDRLTKKEIDLIVFGMTGAQYPMDNQKDAFELVARLRAALRELGT